MLVVITTVPNADEAKALAERVVSGQLAACVHILPDISSVYVWKGKVQKEPEHLLLIKTLPEKYDELEAFITANHSYDVPEIVAVDAEKVSQSYLAWMREVLGSESYV